MTMEESVTPAPVDAPAPSLADQHDTNDTTPIQNGDGEAHISPIDRNEAIQEGKQRAQAVLAASAAQLGNGSDHESSRQASKTPEVKEEPAADTLQTRKRSRSGSRISHESAQPTRSDSPPLTTEQLLLDQYYYRDQLGNKTFSNAVEKNQRTIAQMRSELDLWKMLRFGPRSQVNPGMMYGEGFAGFGNGWTARYPSRVVYPPQRKRPGTRKTGEIRTLRKDRVVQAEQNEDLVPIRIDIEHDKIRLRDTFTWNVHDRLTPPQLFAQGLVEDFNIPAEATGPLTQQVYQAIQEQISDFHPHFFFAPQEPLDLHLPYSAYKNDELRILIKLNITIGQHTLVDQFDWDLNNKDNSAEEFAIQMAKDLSLSGEFMTAIAHSIREQTQMFTKSLYIANHAFDGRPVEDPEVKENLLPSPIFSAFRAFQSAKDYTPYFYELNEADLEKNELAFSREQRQQKRSVNRRGGPSLPDLKERLRTVRTMVVSSVIPGAADSIEHTGVYKPTRSASGRGRRPYRADRGEDSEISESEESETDSPARGLQGTSRTRGMRGAASAAQAAMRAANMTRSITPELSLHHHETRTLAKRVGAFEAREESVSEPMTLTVKLKIPRDRYRKWWHEYKTMVQRRQLHHQQQAHTAHRQQMPMQQPPSYPSNPYLPQQGQPPYGTPGAMRPPPPTSTPNFQQQHQQQQRFMPTPQQQQQQQRMFGQQQHFGQRTPAHDPMQQQRFAGQMDGGGPGTPAPPGGGGLYAGTPSMGDQRRSPHPGWSYGGPQ